MCFRGRLATDRFVLIIQTQYTMNDKGETDSYGYGIQRITTTAPAYTEERPKRHTLSPRELEMLTWASHGHTTQQISVMLYISPETVETHRKNIMRKLCANNMIAAVAMALRRNLIK
ncbi:MAG: DNA-binding response regulator [Bacteroidetes bacterium]|nr:DNA-binding response regulator [Bacteroidota bacterium]